MRVGLLTTSFPRWPQDIAGAFVLGFARALVARGHCVDVLAPEPAQRLPAPRWRGVQARWVPYARPRRLQRTFYGAGVPDNLAADPLAWLGLASFPVAQLHAARRAARGWDALVSHWALPSALAAAAAAGGRPHLAVLHSADVHLLCRLPAGRRWAEHIAAGADTLLFCSRPLRDAFLALLPGRKQEALQGRVHVCPMGIDPPRLPTGGRAAARRRLGLTRPTLLALGRLVPIKGLDDAVRAVGGRHDVELIIAGAGPVRAELEQLARAHRAPVRFVGLATGERKDLLMAAADGFVAPSRVTPTGRTEGTPTVVLEAMAAGLPVVASDTGGIGSVVLHEHTGLLVPPGRPDALRTAFDRLLADGALRARLAQRAAEQGRRYCWSALAPWLEQLLAGGRAPPLASAPRAPHGWTTLVPGGG